MYIKILILNFIFSFNTCFAKNFLSGILNIDENKFTINFHNDINQSQVTVQHLEGIIQLTIKDVILDKAKILPIEKGLVSKVFIYQYSPDTVRCRFSINKSFNSLEENFFNFKLSGKKILINFYESKNFEIKESKKEIVNLTQEDNLIKSDDIIKNKLKDKNYEFNYLRHFKWIFFLSFFIVITFFIFKIKNIKFSKNLPEFFKNIKDEFNKNNKNILLISNYNLDYKNKITLLKVLDKYLVIGVSQNGINLISEFFYEEEIELKDFNENKKEDESLLKKNSFKEFFNDKNYSYNSKKRIKDKIDKLKTL